MSSARARSRPAVVLLVEDNPDHAFLTEEAFRAARVRLEIHNVTDGAQALRFLRRLPPYEAAPHPDLILLDIHMPRVDGYEVMEEISRDQDLQSSVIVVLTTSSDILDVDRMYALGCTSYITKPVKFSEFDEVVRRLGEYWFELVLLPEQVSALRDR